MAPVSKVFEGVSSPIHLVNWWPLKCSGRPEIGQEYNFNFTDQYDWYGKVSKCDKNRTFHVKMTRSDADWDPTTFGFDLEENEKGTWVQFMHVGWPETNQHFRIASFCWATLLTGLKNYIENGVVIPFEERE